MNMYRFVVTHTVLYLCKIAAAAYDTDKKTQFNRKACALTHARTHAHTQAHAHTHTRTLCGGVLRSWLSSLCRDRIIFLSLLI